MRDAPDPTTLHPVDDPDDPEAFERATVVGHDVWFGYQTLVMPGVTIGHGVVVAAASVVAADVLPYAIVTENARTIMAGEPAELERIGTANGCS